MLKAGRDVLPCTTADWGVRGDPPEGHDSVWHAASSTCKDRRQSTWRPVVAQIDSVTEVAYIEAETMALQEAAGKLAGFSLL